MQREENMNLIRNRVTMSLAAFLALANPALPTCPSLPGSGPRITWDLTSWTYSGSESTTGIAAAMGAWNAGQDHTRLCNLPDCQSPGVDIYISDDSTLSDLGA